MDETTVINKIYAPCGKGPLGPRQLAYEANLICKHPVFRMSDFPARISGCHCHCKAGGEFVLLRADDAACIEAQKRYMICSLCGGVSHL